MMVVRLAHLFDLDRVTLTLHVAFSAVTVSTMANTQQKAQGAIWSLEKNSVSFVKKVRGVFRKDTWH